MKVGRNTGMRYITERYGISKAMYKKLVKVSIHKGDGVPLSTKASFNFEVRPFMRFLGDYRPYSNSMIIPSYVINNGNDVYIDDYINMLEDWLRQRDFLTFFHNVLMWCELSEMEVFGTNGGITQDINGDIYISAVSYESTEKSKDIVYMVNTYYSRLLRTFHAAFRSMSEYDVTGTVDFYVLVREKVLLQLSEKSTMLSDSLQEAYGSDEMSLLAQKRAVDGLIEKVTYYMSNIK